MKLLYGKVVAEKIYQEIKAEIKLKKIKPAMAVILVGNLAASLSFIKAKEKISKDLGIGFKLYHFLEIVTEREVLNLITVLNKNSNINGIIVQLPLPENIKTESIIKAIDPGKDIDGLLGEILTPSAAAVLGILKFYEISLKNKKIVLVGHGRLVGQPLNKQLIKIGNAPIICDKNTPDLSQETLKADILISATGVPGLIKPDMVKNSVAIVDAGTAEADGQITGDVDKATYEKVFAVSPVPGGVGPLTVAYLMKNLVNAATY